MTCIFDKFLLNYGWQHFWYEPDTNIYAKQYVKGPFSSSKLVYSLPYLTQSETKGKPLEFRTGIPDCWGEYLIHKLLGDYESMHKEDVDIAHKLRKDYHMYLGQGIPNPWLAPNVNNPVVPSCKGLKENLRKYLLQSSESKNKNGKGNCLCCKKNYLLECPDKTNDKNRGCTCKTCHSGEIHCGESCKCIEILQNWVLEDVHLKEKRRKEGKTNREKVCRCSSESSGCETDDERTNVSSGKPCNCRRSVRMAFAAISSANSDASCFERQSKHEFIFGKDFLYKGFTEKKGKYGIFPYARNICQENKCLKIKDVKAISKQSQTESQFFGDTKPTQTENTENKIQTSNKCFRCTMYQYQQFACKVNPFEKGVCISPGVINSHAIFCPYTCHDHLLDQKYHCVNSLEKKQKKKKQGNAGDHQKHLRVEDNVNPYNLIDGFKPLESPKSPNSPRINHVGDCHQPSLRTFDSLKYLTDTRLKNYIRERETLRRFRNTTISQGLMGASKLGSFVREEQSLPQRLEKLKFFNQKPNILCSPHADRPRKGIMYVDRGVMTRPEEVTRKNELITKYFKNAVESDESRTYGLVRVHENKRKRMKFIYGRRGMRKGGRKNRTLMAKVNRIPKSEQEEPAGKSEENDSELSIRRTHRSLGVTNFITGD